MPPALKRIKSNNKLQNDTKNREKVERQKKTTNKVAVAKISKTRGKNKLKNNEIIDDHSGRTKSNSHLSRMDDENVTNSKKEPKFVAQSKEPTKSKSAKVQRTSKNANAKTDVKPNNKVPQTEDRNLRLVTGINSNKSTVQTASNRSPRIKAKNSEIKPSKSSVTSSKVKNKKSHEKKTKIVVNLTKGERQSNDSLIVKSEDSANSDDISFMSDSDSDDSDSEDVRNTPKVQNKNSAKAVKRKSSDENDNSPHSKHPKLTSISNSFVKLEKIPAKSNRKEIKKSSKSSNTSEKSESQVSKKRKKDSCETNADTMVSQSPKVKKESRSKSTKTIKKKEMKKKLKTESGKKENFKIEKLPQPGFDESDVTSVLLRMEGQSQTTTTVTGTDNSSLDSSDSDEESNWEEVADHHSPVKSQIPANPVEITLDVPDILKKKKRKKFDWKAWVQRKIRRFQKDVRISVHKVELLCLLSHGMQQNAICNNSSLIGQALSLAPVNISKGNIMSQDVNGLKRLVKWFKGLIGYDSTATDEGSGLVQCSVLEAGFNSKQTTSEKQLILIFIILMRAIGFDVRLVLSFQPLPIKENVKSPTKKNKPSMSKLKKKTPEKQRTQNKLHPEKSKPKNNSVKTKEAKTNPKLKTKNLRKRRSASKVLKQSDVDSDSGSDDFVPSSDNESNYSDEESCGKQRKNSGKSTNAKRKSTSTRNKEDTSSIESSCDFEEETIEYRSPTADRIKRPIKKNRKILSSDSNDSTDIKTPEITGTDLWAEVYLPEEKQWICIDCISEVINKPYEIEATATPPLHYCLAYSNDGSVKDVTARYASNWMSQTRKLRVDSDWWRETLAVYRSQEEHNQQDDENIKDQLVNRPLPTSISQFKNHPLYVLQRHLLKFEAIYPHDAAPCGFVRKEPVYPRECVYVLHSRENWRKEGRSVMIGEEPYKMVKSRPKWNKPKENPDALDLELFGEWQTEIYIPPPVVDGKIPRNEYGNVELFKPWMLPAGTVHIKVTALNRIAKKLGVDCVAAMTGWDYHGGFSHALLEGWIVCEEHSEALMAAWEEDQLIQQEKEAEKREKRVVGNWKLLIRGLLIKDKLKRKFDLQEAVVKEKQEVPVRKNKKTKKEEEPANDVALSWPRRQMKPDDATTSKHFIVETM
ncbi:DNA repair protein complementing XP-C cells homolog isoform X2 [Patella vulgata]|nr:DNA repair protein complementing XP-C cells homolog isoform X2 [Patella vulgata]